jgi:hypothetical protein
MYMGRESQEGSPTRENNRVARIAAARARLEARRAIRLARTAMDKAILQQDTNAKSNATVQLKTYGAAQLLISEISDAGKLSKAIAGAVTSNSEVADRHKQSELTARRAAAIVGAFQALQDQEINTEEMREKLAVEIMKATMPKKWLDAIKKLPQQRAMPFASKVAKSGAAILFLKGALVAAGSAAQPIMWLAAALFLPPVTVRMASAIHDLVRGVPDQKRTQEVATLVRSTMRATEYITDKKLVGQMANALVASIQKVNVGLDKAWLKKVVIESVPPEHLDTVKAEVDKVTPGKFTTAINKYLGTNFGGKRSYIR